MTFSFGRRRAAAPAGQPAWQNPVASRRGVGGGWLLVVIVVMLALLLGAVIALDSPMLTTILGGVNFIILIFLLLNSHQLLLALLVLTFVIQGMAVYFLSNRQAPWVVLGLAVIFFIRAMMELVFARKKQVRPHSGSGDIAVLVSLMLYALTFIVSALFNRSSGGQLVVAIKAALPMFGVLLALAWIRLEQVQLARLWTIMIGVCLVQLPVATYQHFFISSARKAAAHDAVVGTFGGNPLGGGNSAILVMFVVAIMGYALARWDKGTMSRRMCTFVMAVGMAVILLGEVKAAFVWLPIAAGFVLRRRILRNVVSFVVYAMLGVLITSGIYLTYNALYWGKIVNRQHSAAAKLQAGGGYFFDPHSINYENGEVGRGAALAIWAQDRMASTQTRLIGYGPGAVKSGPGLGVGPLYKRFAPLHVDPTSLAVLLWDVGVLGSASYIAMILFGIRTGWRFIASGRGSPGEQAIAETSTATLVLFASLLIYNRTLMDDPSSQLLFALALGCVLQLTRYAGPASEKTPKEALPRGRGRHHAGLGHAVPPVPVTRLPAHG